MRHDFVDHVLGLASNSIDDVADADRLGNVMDKENQTDNKREREDQRACNTRNRSERLRANMIILASGNP